jgi:hypothetical protein
MKQKKAQEEMMGFVVIIVIVVVIGVVFLGFSMHRNSKNVEPHSMMVDDMMQSMLVYTTNCSSNTNQYNVRELIRICNNNPSGKCDDGSDFCDKLSVTMNYILDSLMGQNVEKGFIHGYEFEINASSPMMIQKGNLTGNYFTSYVPVPLMTGEDAQITFRSYYG